MENNIIPLDLYTTEVWVISDSTPPGDQNQNTLIFTFLKNAFIFRSNNLHLPIQSHFQLLTDDLIEL